jgi:tRNA (cytidine32/uridine32-2'-O)-methyltransferase
MSIPVRIVLVGTTHPGNIGAAARAMRTMGLDRLSLVARGNSRARRRPRAPRARMRAGRRRVCATLEEALADCRYVRSAPAPGCAACRGRSLSPREAAPRLLAETAHGEVAVVFGRESSGLSNDELACCHALLHIPTDPGFSSLNLAMAVQVVAYELRLAMLDGAAPAPAAERLDPLATVEDVERFYAHLERTLVDAGFLNPENPRHLMLQDSPAVQPGTSWRKRRSGYCGAS